MEPELLEISALYSAGESLPSLFASDAVKFFDSDGYPFSSSELREPLWSVSSDENELALGIVEVPDVPVVPAVEVPVVPVDVPVVD